MVDLATGGSPGAAPWGYHCLLWPAGWRHNGHRARDAPGTRQCVERPLACDRDRPGPTDPLNAAPNDHYLRVQVTDKMIKQIDEAITVDVPTLISQFNNPYGFDGS